MVCYKLPHPTLYKMRGNAVTQRFFHWATPPHYNWLFNLSWDTPSDTVMEITKWDSILDLYKLSVIVLFYNIVIKKIPKTISDLVTWRHGPYNLRGHLKTVVPRFSTSFLKNSIRYRGAALWNVKLF